jgi:hypothetical protein
VSHFARGDLWREHRSTFLCQTRSQKVAWIEWKLYALQETNNKEPLLQWLLFLLLMCLFLSLSRTPRRQQEVFLFSKLRHHQHQSLCVFWSCVFINSFWNLIKSTTVCDREAESKFHCDAHFGLHEWFSPTHQTSDSRPNWSWQNKLCAYCCCFNEETMCALMMAARLAPRIRTYTPPSFLMRVATKGEINHTLEYLYLLEHVNRLRRLKGRRRGLCASRLNLIRQKESEMW